MTGEAFAFFRWVSYWASYWDTRLGEEDMGHGWGCQPCRDGWKQILLGWYSRA